MLLFQLRHNRPLRFYLPLHAAALVFSTGLMLLYCLLHLG